MSSQLRHPSTSGRAGVALVALALVLALAAWWLSREPTPDAVDPSHAASVPAADRSAPLAATSVPTDTATRTAASGPEVATVDAAPESLDTTPREPIDVLVVDRETGEPVAGAEVRWANFSELEFHGSERPHWRPDPIAHFASARRATTDVAGVARIDARVFPGSVLARHGTRFGRATADESLPRPIRVAIAPELGLVIQVVDDAGRPVAGVPVCLRDVPHLETMGEFWTGTTDGPAGLIHVRDFGFVRPGTQRPTKVFACLDVVLAEPVCVPVDLTSPPAEPVRLVLPPCGSVEIALRDSQGRPASTLLLHLGLASKADRKGDLRWASRGYEPDEQREGEALYRFVGLGLDLHAVAMRLGDNAIARGPGPRVAGEIARLELDLGAPCVAFTGRLVTESGEPIRDRLVQVGVESKNVHGASGSSTSPRRTDADGRFRISTLTPAGTDLTAALVVRPSGLGPGEGGEAQREVRYEKAPVDAELGDLVVAMPQVVGAGVVVDDLGQPLAGAVLSIHASRPEVENGAWRNSSLVRPVMRPDGSFELRSVVEVARLRVAAMRQGHAESERVEFEPGRRDLRLVAPRACELSGRALLDEGVDGQRIRVRVLVPGAPIPTEQLGTDREGRIGADGAFRIAPLPPGRYDLDFRFLANGEPFHRIEGIEVVPAGRAVDARLDAVDLRGKVPAGAR